MTPEEEHVQEVLFDLAVQRIRADLAADLRELAERFVSEVHALRVELRRDLGLAPLFEAEAEEGPVERFQ